MSAARAAARTAHELGYQPSGLDRLQQLVEQRQDLSALIDAEVNGLVAAGVGSPVIARGARGEPPLNPGRFSPKTPKVVANERLREYVQERLSGQVQRCDGTPVRGPETAMWKSRNKPRRQDRRWATAWSPE